MNKSDWQDRIAEDHLIWAVMTSNFGHIQTTLQIKAGKRLKGNVMERYRSRARAFLRRRIWQDESGSATVEFVMMVPVFMALILLVADASFLYNKQAMLMNVSRDTARIVSRYALTAEEAQAHAVKLAGANGASATANVSITDGFVTVTVAADAASAAPFGLIKFAITEKISATATVVMEPV